MLPPIYNDVIKSSWSGNICLLTWFGWNKVGIIFEFCDIANFM